MKIKYLSGYPESDTQYGIHPWFLTEDNLELQFSSVRNLAGHPEILAIGEAGFDHLRGPSPEIQRKAFEKQICTFRGGKETCDNSLCESVG